MVYLRKNQKSRYLEQLKTYSSHLNFQEDFEML
jgi:hypothetical protein